EVRFFDFGEAARGQHRAVDVLHDSRQVADLAIISDDAGFLAARRSIADESHFQLSPSSVLFCVDKSAPSCMAGGRGQPSLGGQKPTASRFRPCARVTAGKFCRIYACFEDQFHRPIIAQSSDAIGCFGLSSRQGRRAGAHGEPMDGATYGLKTQGITPARSENRQYLLQSCPPVSTVAAPTFTRRRRLEVASQVVAPDDFVLRASATTNSAGLGT